MSFDFFVNGLDNGIIQTPNDYFREQQQAAINQEWEVTTSRYTVQEQSNIGSSTYADIEVWIDYVVGMTSRGMTNGDDFRQLLFEDINHPVKRGLYYQFDENTWITYFTDNYASVGVDIGVRRCNNVLRIIDPENGAIFSAPCVVDYDMTSPSAQVSRAIITPNNHATIMVQGNKDTLRLFTLNKRFMLGGRPFKLLAYQNTLVNKSISPDPTLLYLDLYLDEIHAQDDIVNQLAYNGNYDYTIEIDSTDMELTNGSSGVLNASVTLNGQEVNRNIVWSSTNPSVVSIDQTGQYQVHGTEGQSCQITVTLEGNNNVTSSIAISVVSTESLQPKIVVDPLFDKVRQFETFTFEVKAAYGSDVYSPTITNISLSSQTQSSANQYLSIKKTGNLYQIKGIQIAPTDQILYITVQNDAPQFMASYELPIKVTSMMD